MEKHTVCLLNDAFPPLLDGVSNAVVNYGKNIAAYHGRAIVVTPDVDGARDEVFPFPVLRYPSIDTRDLTGYVAGCPFSPQIAGQLRAERVELLHAHCPISSCFLARSLRDVLAVPLVLTYHTKYDIEIERIFHSRALQKEAIHALLQNINSCDEVWTVSRGAGENLCSLGYEGEYIVMENGVDLPRGAASQKAVAAVTEEYDLPNGIPIFLFVGRLMWYKGLRIILDALKILQEAGHDFRMVFVGDGADRAAAQEHAAKIRVDGKCILVGAVNEREILRAWYTRADLFLFPSTFDTNGLVVREAAACGTASVLAKGVCTAECVADGETGFLIEESAAALAEKLKVLCSAPETMHRVGECAQRELYLSWETAVARAWERYEIILDNYRCGRCKKHDTPFDGFLRLQGRLMEALAETNSLQSSYRE